MWLKSDISIIIIILVCHMELNQKTDALTSSNNYNNKINAQPYLDRLKSNNIKRQIKQKYKGNFYVNEKRRNLPKNKFAKEPLLYKSTKEILNVEKSAHHTFSRNLDHNAENPKMTVRAFRNTEGEFNSSILTESMACSVFGNWFSKMGGITLNITIPNAKNGNDAGNVTINTKIKYLHVEINDSNLKPPNGDPPLLNKTWNITGRLLNSQMETLMLTAEQKFDKNAAVFIGQCRVCEGIESIMGQWLIHYHTSDCRSIHTSQEIKGDIFNRNENKNEQCL